MSLGFDDNDFMSIRKNLVIVSIIWLIIIYGEVEVGNKVSLLFTSIKLKNPDVLTALLSLLFIYLNWKFLQVVKPIFYEFQNKYLRLLSSKKGNNHYEKLMIKLFSENNPTAKNIQAGINLNQHKILFRRGFIINYNTGETAQNTSQLKQFRKEEYLTMFDLRELMLYVWSEKLFTDLFLPIILSIAVIISILIHLIV
ncbi:MAG: hypothetical protein RLO81_12385 [Fulvivirga sp.]|uniref:hypothetical protein n=1 Tax=Fulvivirga sp. TaxID=1931237 RepID=UPI0032EDEEE6